MSPGQKTNPGKLVTPNGHPLNLPNLEYCIHYIRTNTFFMHHKETFLLKCSSKKYEWCEIRISKRKTVYQSTGSARL